MCKSHLRKHRNDDLEENPLQPQPVTSQALSNNNFVSLMQKRSNDTVWQTIEMIQGCVKSRKSIGKPLNLKFYAVLNEADPLAEIKYEIKRDKTTTP